MFKEPYWNLEISPAAWLRILDTIFKSQIDERDPLPKAICVQCLGKLEFVCDFQEECLRTQQLLRDQYNLPPLSDIVSLYFHTSTALPFLKILYSLTYFLFKIAISKL